MRYLTLAQYQSSADGISTTGLTDIALARFIQRAEADIDAFMGFDLNQSGGFDPHSSWLQSGFDGRTRQLSAPDTVVPMRQVLRYRIQVSNLSGGDGFFANIQPSDCAINVSESYIEIVPLQSITYSLAPVLMQLGLTPPIVQMDVEVGFYLPYYNQTLFPAGGTTFVATRGFWATTYTQSLATQPNVLPPVPPVVYFNGVAQDPSTYNLSETEGQVIFVQDIIGSPQITADYTTTIPDNVVAATISRTTYLLAQSRLNANGLNGLELIRSGDQMVSRGREHSVLGVYGSLDRETAGYLSPYVQIAIA